MHFLCSLSLQIYLVSNAYSKCDLLICLFFLHKPLNYLRAKTVYYIYIYESESHSVVSDSLLTAWTIQSVGFSRPEYWSGQPFPSPGDLPNPSVPGLGRSPGEGNGSPLCVYTIESLPLTDSKPRQGQLHVVVVESNLTVCDPVDHQSPLSVDFPGKNIGVDCHFLSEKLFDE